MLKKTPTPGAQRKRDHDNRQRAMGRLPQTYWLTGAEATAVKRFIQELRDPIFPPQETGTP